MHKVPLHVRCLPNRLEKFQWFFESILKWGSLHTKLEKTKIFHFEIIFIYFSGEAFLGKKTLCSKKLIYMQEEKEEVSKQFLT